jgi:flagellar biosynthetic protein FliR
MVTVSSHVLIELMLSFIWPLTRILGLLVIAPPIANTTVAPQIKVALAIMLALIVAPTVGPLPNADPLSLAGIMVLIQEFVIGVAMGFVMNVVFSGIEMAGEVMGLTMGLGFATFFDPQTQGRSSAIAQFLVLLATVLFFAFNVHLTMLATLIESFKTIPVSTSLSAGFGFQKLALWGGEVFSAGLRLSLPIVAMLLITNIALGILTRAAPQLNLFGIGFPITIGVGFLMVALIVPYLTQPIESMFLRGIEAMQSLAPAGTPPKPLPFSQN